VGTGGKTTTPQNLRCQKRPREIFDGDVWIPRTQVFPLTVKEITIATDAWTSARPALIGEHQSDVDVAAEAAYRRGVEAYQASVDVHFLRRQGHDDNLGAARRRVGLYAGTLRPPQEDDGWGFLPGASPPPTPALSPDQRVYDSDSALLAERAAIDEEARGLNDVWRRLEVERSRLMAARDELGDALLEQVAGSEADPFFVSVENLDDCLDSLDSDERTRAHLMQANDVVAYGHEADDEAGISAHAFQVRLHCILVEPGDRARLASQFYCPACRKFVPMRLIADLNPVYNNLFPRYREAHS